MKKFIKWSKSKCEKLKAFFATKLRQIIVSLLFGLAMYLIMSYSFFSALIILIVSNFLLDYLMEMHIDTKRIIQSRTETFNSDYYDLYWKFNARRMKFTFSCICFFLTIIGQSNFIRNSEIEQKISCGMGGVLGAFLFSAIMLGCLNHNIKVLEKLINTKGENYTQYTENEILILSNLK